MVSTGGHGRHTGRACRDRPCLRHFSSVHESGDCFTLRTPRFFVSLTKMESVESVGGEGHACKAACSQFHVRSEERAEIIPLTQGRILFPSATRSPDQALFFTNRSICDHVFGRKNWLLRGSTWRTVGENLMFWRMPCFFCFGVRVLCWKTECVRMIVSCRNSTVPTEMCSQSPPPVALQQQRRASKLSVRSLGLALRELGPMFCVNPNTSTMWHRSPNISFLIAFHAEVPNVLRSELLVGWTVSRPNASGWLCFVCVWLCVLVGRGRQRAAFHDV